MLSDISDIDEYRNQIVRGNLLNSSKLVSVVANCVLPDLCGRGNSAGNETFEWHRMSASMKHKGNIAVKEPLTLIALEFSVSPNIFSPVIQTIFHPAFKTGEHPLC